MHVLIAVDSFKGSLTAMEAAEAIARGVQQVQVGATVDLCPLADGGEGTAEVLVSAKGGRMQRARVVGPLGQPVDAAWGLVNDGRTAVIEMAQAAGLTLVPPDRRDPTRTTTYGVGQLIKVALDSGCEKIEVGIGGSSTCDGGAGMAQALGVRFTFDDEVRDGGGFMAGGDLLKVRTIDAGEMDERVFNTEIAVACDVTNPLIGPSGAAVMYAPQKGATEAQVEWLDRGLTHLAELMEVDPYGEGYGSTGGLGYGMVAFCGAKLIRGIDWVLDVVGYDERVKQADLVITGEGSLDHQSLEGKAVMGAVQRAKACGVPVIALAGRAGQGAERCLEAGLDGYDTLMDIAENEADAMVNAGRLLTTLTARVLEEV